MYRVATIVTTIIGVLLLSMLESENPGGRQKALAMAETSVGVHQSSSRSGGIESSLSARHVLYLLLIRICTHTHTSPSHSSHALLCRLCWQMLDPPHSLHRLVCRLCWQIPSLRTPCITSAAPSSFPSRSLRPQAQHCEHLSAAVPRTRSAPSSGDGTTKSERSWPRSSPHTPRCFRKARRRQ